MKKLTRLGGLLIGIGAVAAGLVWLLKGRTNGRPRSSTSDEAPGAGAEPVDTEPRPEDLSEVTGIGPAYRARLADAGIATYAALAAADPASLAETIDVAESRIADWIDQASRLASS